MKYFFNLQEKLFKEDNAAIKESNYLSFKKIGPSANLLPSVWYSVAILLRCHPSAILLPSGFSPQESFDIYRESKGVHLH